MNVRSIKSVISNPQLLTQSNEISKSSTTTTSNRPTILSTANIASLWLSLVGLYSHLFINKYGMEDSGVWLETLKDLTPRALDNGIETLRSGGAGDAFCEYPPNPMQFRKLCLAFMLSYVCHLFQMHTTKSNVVHTQHRLTGVTRR